jgi:hypothetical protein
MFALDTANSQWVALSADSNGNLQASQLDTSGNKVDPATEQTLQTIADAASTNANDQLRIETPSPIDVSAAEVDVDLATQSLATLTVTDNGSLDINSVSSELDVDLNTQTLAALTVTDDGSLNINDYTGSTITTALEGTDNAGNTESVQAEDLGTALNGTETAIVTSLSRALSEVGSTNLQVDLQSTGITLPVDQQAALETTSQDYGVAVDTQVQRTLQIDGFTTVEVLYNGASTDVTVEKTWDETNFFPVASATGTGDYNPKFTDQGGKFIRVTVTGTGTSGDTADLVVEAKP